jgi:galactose oxidase-like protein
MRSGSLLILLCAALGLTACSVPGCSTSWKQTGAMSTMRAGHTATLLRDGTVLVVGGFNADAILASAERYDPASRSWSPVAPMHTARARHTATRLQDGTVLVVGGATNRQDPSVSTNTAERFDPTSNTWRDVSTMVFPRYFHTATLLPDGTVLVVAGGPFGRVDAQRSAERYDPGRDAWTAAGSTAAVHNRGTATLLLDGTVLLAGGVQWGFEVGDATEVLIVYSERYDPLTNSWIELALLNESPFAHTATRLGDGGVLIAGGRNTAQTYKSAIRYLPSFRRGGDYQSDLWQHVPDMTEPRTNHQATGLFDGSVLITGGFFNCVLRGETPPGCERSLYSVERYRPDPSNLVGGSWVKEDSMLRARGDHTATFLPRTCEVLVTGGQEWNPNDFLATAEVYPVLCARTQIESQFVF